MNEYRNYMQMMGMPNQCCKMMDTSPGRLESMYPRVYNIAYPHVKYHCDMFDAKYGMMEPTKQQLDDMVDDIYKKIEIEVDIDVELPRDDERQFGYGRRPFLRDLLAILLIGQLLGRRRYPYWGYGGYPGGYGIY